jgi:hypothetical protein
MSTLAEALGPVKGQPTIRSANHASQLLGCSTGACGIGWHRDDQSLALTHHAALTVSPFLNLASHLTASPSGAVLEWHPLANGVKEGIDL